MTRDEIMELAQGTAGQHWMDKAHIQRFASALIAAEREERLAEWADWDKNRARHVALKEAK